MFIGAGMIPSRRRVKLSSSQRLWRSSAAKRVRPATSKMAMAIFFKVWRKIFHHTFIAFHVRTSAKLVPVSPAEYDLGRLFQQPEEKIDLGWAALLLAQTE